jgi:hypothetical protein
LYAQGGLFVLTGLQSGNVIVRNLLTNVTFANGPFQGKKILDFKNSVVRSFNLSYDAKRIVFAWVFNPISGNGDSCKLQICIMNMDGTNLQLLTPDTKHENLDPVFLPNGRIAFVSTRNEMTVRCNDGNTPQATLFSMKDDGSDVTRLSYHETNERYPSVDNDGKILYMRWDYIDRDFGAAQGMWQCEQDGTNPRAPADNYPQPNDCFWNVADGRLNRPYAEYWMHAIPGSQKIMLIAASHHSPPYGNVCLVDRDVRDDNAMAQIKVLTSGGLPLAGEKGCYSQRGFYNGPCQYVPVKKDYGYWEPVPLSETYVLIPWDTIGSTMYQPQQGAMQENFTRCNMKLYLLDDKGNRTLVDPCSAGSLGGNFVNVRIYRPQTLPPNTTTQTFDGERASLPGHMRATLSILNVNVVDIPNPPNVVIKKLRIVQLFPHVWSDPAIESPHFGWSEGGICRASLGTVPVEKDGSVYCEAPVNKGLMFQLLDSNGCAVRTMRSLTYVHPGENLSCTGCHEDKWTAVPPGAAPLAFQRAPSQLTKEPGSQVPVSFGTVEPIFQNTCLPCHKSKNKGLQDFTYNDPGSIAAFPDTNDKTKLVNYCWWYDASNNSDGEGPYGGYRSAPYKFGFMFSRLGRHLMAPGNSCTAGIPDTMLQKVKLWMDLNCMRYGHPTGDQTQANLEFTGGDYTWPAQMSKSNPTGVELDRPVPTGIINIWENHGVIADYNAVQHAIRFTGGNRCEISGVQGAARVTVIDLAGRTLWSHAFSLQSKESVYRFSLGAIAGKNSSAVLFVSVTADNTKQAERYIRLGNR